MNQACCPTRWSRLATITWPKGQAGLGKGSLLPNLNSPLQWSYKSPTPYWSSMDDFRVVALWVLLGSGLTPVELRW